MSLNREQVIAAHRLLKGTTPTPDEAQRVIDLLQSRQEMLASLITHDKAFAGHPNLMAALREAAHMSHSQARTPRKQRGDAQAIGQNALAVYDKIASFIAAQSHELNRANELHEVIRRQVMASPIANSHPGYHWLVDREP